MRAVRARRYEILTEWNEFQFEGEAAGEEEEADELDEDVEAALAGHTRDNACETASCW